MRFLPRRHSGLKLVMAGLDPAISRQRQIRGSSPRMTYYKTVMAGLDPAISSRALEEITGSSPVMTWK